MQTEPREPGSVSRDGTAKALWLAHWAKPARATGRSKAAGRSGAVFRQSLERWKKERNAQRAELEAEHGYDTKHAMHLMRLLRMGLEVVERGDVTVDRTKIDADQLLAVRAGRLPYDTLLGEATALVESVNEAYNARYVRREFAPAVPADTDDAAPDAWCTELVVEHLCSARFTT